MKKAIGYLLIIIFFIFIFCIYLKEYSNNNVDIIGGNLKFGIKYKGLTDAKDFTFDSEGNFFVAYSNKVQLIDASGKSYILFKEEGLNITSIEYWDNKLYYISDCKLISYDLSQKKYSEIINSIPNYGDYRESKLLVKDDIIYITIGAATNSGVVGEDNSWVKENPFNHDISPKSLNISSKISKRYNTGAFVPYNVKNIPNQIIPAHKLGSASVVTFNIKNKDISLFAWGIRNVNGIDFNSVGKIYISVGGMEDRGNRPVKGDSDYIYELNESVWYGWPDYSGGDPVTSPKFKGLNNESISFVLEKHPTTNPPAPFYQHKSVGDLKNIHVDRKGQWAEKDSIFFYVVKDNILYNVNKHGILNNIIRFPKETYVKSIKGDEKKLLLLDSQRGLLQYLEKKDINIIRSYKNNVAVYSLTIIILIILCILWKVKH